MDDFGSCRKENNLRSDCLAKKEVGGEYEVTVYDINGVEVVMYSIGDLAQELGRESQTIRKWELNGVIPPTRF